MKITRADIPSPYFEVLLDRLGIPEDHIVDNLTIELKDYVYDTKQDNIPDQEKGILFP